jgi:HK97 family phage portal protein
MSLWTDLTSWLFAPAAEKAAPPTPAWHLATTNVEHWSADDAGLGEFADIYRKLTWVQLAIGTVARTAAGAGLEVFQLQEEERKQIDNHPFEQLLQRPNPTMSRFELLEATFAYRLLTGNAYWWLSRNGPNAPIREIWMLPAQRVRPAPDGRLGVRGYLYDPGDGTEIPLEAWEVCHFRMFNPNNSLVGLSPMEALRLTNRGDLAMQRWNTNYFDKDNAKPAGALAFADPIADSEWERMKADVKREHGGTRRSLMMLRNVGAGGVQWVSMAMSQADMQFLESRTFNKEEIIALYAPGLASVLAVNATEANALAGKKTLLEFGVWPHLMAVGEKISNDIMSAYGPNLIASFADIRETDRAMRLQEQAAYAAVHTIDEVRAEFYQSPPIGDERGALLTAQVAAGGLGDTEPRPEDSRTEPDVTPRQAQLPAEVKAAELRIVVLPSQEVRGADAEPAPSQGEPHSPEPIKAVLQLDPDDDEAEARIREALEDRFGRELATALRGQLDTLLPDGATDSEIRAAVGRLAETTGPVQTVIEENLRRGADLGVTVAQDTLGRVGIGVDWALAHAEASAWVRPYAFELVQGITSTTAAHLQRGVARYFDEGLPLADLRDELEPLFGTQRARLIAQTETTRAAAEGTRAGFVQSGVISEMEIRAVNDERVCPVCGPLHGTRTPLQGGKRPPFHPGCRCYLVGVVGEAPEEQGMAGNTPVLSAKQDEQPDEPREEQEEQVDAQ